MPSAKALSVEQLDRKTGEVVATHDSVYAAAEALNIAGGAGNINRVANGKAKSAYGFGWRYKTASTTDDAVVKDEEWRPFEDVEVSSYGRVRRVTAAGQAYVSECKPVMTINTKRWPVHRLIAHVFMGMPDDPSITVKVTGEPPCINNIVIISQSQNKRARDEHDNPKAPKRVQQWTHDGDVMLNQYASVSEAARVHGISTSHICKSAAGTEKTAGGFVWKYA